MYIKVEVPANGLNVNNNDFVALHSIGKYSEGLRVLIRVESSTRIETLNPSEPRISA